MKKDYKIDGLEEKEQLSDFMRYPLSSNLYPLLYWTLDIW